MASPAQILPFLLPRGASRTAMRLFPGRNGRPRLPPSPLHTSSSASCRNNSSKSRQPKPRVIPKPDKFRPPSHGARRVTRKNDAPRNYPGPAATPEEIEAKKTRKYPNMFPPEGTVMHKFLTARWIHLWISMGVLFSLAGFTFITNFKQTSPVAHLLPSWSQLIPHPIDTISQFFSVIRMNAEHNTLQSKEKRKRIVDDVVKRREYRIAHGLEEPDPQTEKKDEDDASPVSGEGENATGVDEEGRRKPVKKWLGIW